MEKEIKCPKSCPECNSMWVKGDREKHWSAEEKQRYFWICERCGWKKYYKNKLQIVKE